MENKRSTKNIKQLILIFVLLIILGIVIGIFNFGQVNEKVAQLTAEETKAEEKKVLDSETIVAAYSPKKEVASQEIVSRYAKSREREMYQRIEEIQISKNMDLTVRCNISREDFIALMAGIKADTSGFFEENAGLIYDVCEKYQLNEIFFCGLIPARFC